MMNNVLLLFMLGNTYSSMASKPIKIAGLEPVLNKTKKSCIASYYRQFPTNIKL